MARRQPATPNDARAWLCALLAAPLLLVASPGCDRDKTASIAPPPEPDYKTSALELPEARDLLHPGSEIDRHEPAFGPRQRYPDCRELLEEGDTPLSSLPADTAEEVALTFFGCKAEAWRRAGDAWYVAYALEAESASGPRDLRFSSYGDDGRLRWSVLLERDEQGAHFLANFRSSFIAPLLPRLVCAGTLWEGGTQVVCARDASGEVVWSGMLPFWSGAAPVARNQSLYATDIGGISRRYPFDGVEMRYLHFDHSGGRSAVYAAGGEHVFFLPATGEPRALTAYDLDDMEIAWRRTTEVPFATGWTHVLPEHDLALLWHEESGHIVGLDTGDGRARFRLHVGETPPDLASSPEALYLLVSRADALNYLYRLDPKTGEPAWVTETPAGTLRIRWSHPGVLLAGSVHTAQIVEKP